MLSLPRTVLADDVVALRPWTPQDVPCIAEASSDPAIVESTTVPYPYSDADGRAFIDRQLGRIDDGKLSLAIDRAGVAVGLVFATPRAIAGVVGIGYWVAPSHRGHGYASAAVTLMSDWLIALPHVDRVEAWVEPSNVASVAELTRAGFAYEGHLSDHVPMATRRASVDVYSRFRG